MPDPLATHVGDKYNIIVYWNLHFHHHPNPVMHKGYSQNTPRDLGRAYTPPLKPERIPLLTTNRQLPEMCLW